MSISDDNWSRFKQNLELILYEKNIRVEGKKQLDNGEQWIIASEDLEELILDIYPGKYEIRCVPRPKGSPVFNEIFSQLESIRLTGIPVNHNYIGTDESGKGDFFGPLVISGFHSNEEINAELYKIGVKDSKKMDDEAVIHMAHAIQELFPGKYYTFSLEPEKYNAWYSQCRLEGKNLNHLLARGHARVIEELLENGNQTNTIVADLFGDPEYIRSALYQQGQKISLMETEHASFYMGVAASGILAREAFLTWLRSYSDLYSVEIPKGASSKAIEAGKVIISKHGRDMLKKTCKLHFKTLKKVLSGSEGEPK